MIFPKAKVWVDIFSLGSGKCRECYVPCVGICSRVSSARWCTCDEHLVALSFMILQAEHNSFFTHISNRTQQKSTVKLYVGIGIGVGDGIGIGVGVGIGVGIRLSWQFDWVVGCNGAYYP